MAELLLCLSPPSALALILMQICACEALDTAASWTTLSEISQTPLYFYTLILVADGALYFMIMLVTLNLVRHRSVARQCGDRDEISNCTRLSISGLCKEYTVQENLTIILSDINGEIKTGDVTVLLGNNGAGMLRAVK